MKRLIFILIVLVVLFPTSVPTRAEKTAKTAPLVITSEDYPLEVGRKTTYTTRGADGKERDITRVIFEKTPLGDMTLYKMAGIIDGKSLGESYIKKTRDSIEFYPASGAEVLHQRFPFPLRNGATYEYQSYYGKVKARVEGPELVKVPAGMFDCLVYIFDELREDTGTTWTTKVWIAPGIGMVKATQRGYIQLLTGIQTGARSASEPGAVLLSNFDFGDDPLVPPLSPKSRWKAGKGDERIFSNCELEPTDGAAGTAFSLKWTYHTKGTWVNVGLSSSSNEPGDLSQYSLISFYIKGRTQRGCSFKIQTASKEGEKSTGAEIPLKLTPHWQKVVIDLKTDPKLKDIDLTKTYSIEFVDWDEGYASNVVWIDEVMLHKTSAIQPGTF